MNAMTRIKRAARKTERERHWIRIGGITIKPVMRLPNPLWWLAVARRGRRAAVSAGEAILDETVPESAPATSLQGVWCGLGAATS